MYPGAFGSKLAIFSTSAKFLDVLSGAPPRHRDHYVRAGVTVRVVMTRRTLSTMIPRGEFTAGSYRLYFQRKKNSPPTTESSAPTVILLSSSRLPSQTRTKNRLSQPPPPSPMLLYGDKRASFPTRRQTEFAWRASPCPRGDGFCCENFIKCCFFDISVRIVRGESPERQSAQ